MAASAEDPSGDLDTVLQRRAELRDSIVVLEYALARPTRAVERDWSADVREALRQVRDDFDVHVAGTESPDGLYAQILNDAPRLANAISRLRAEHQEIQRALADAAHSLTGRSHGEEREAGVREELTRLLGRLVRHRQRGADLLYEAFHIDVGGET